MTPISLTSLTLVADAAMSPTEVRVHPDLVHRIKNAFIEADMIRSIYKSAPKQFPHTFSSVGDGEDAA